MKIKTKILIIIFLILLISSLICIGVIYFKNDNKVAVLGYHGVLPKEKNTSNDPLIIDAELFEKQLKFLKRMNYDTMTLDEFNCWKKGKCEKKHKSVLITFDDGYQNNYEYAFELLKKYEMNAVVFCVGDHIFSNNEIFMDLETIKESVDKYPNIEFASHSYNLHHRGDRGYESVTKDINLMKKVIETKYYAYPYGEHNPGYIKALMDNGYELTFTFGPGKEHRKADIKDNNYKIPRLNISNDMSILKFIARILLPL